MLESASADRPAPAGDISPGPIVDAILGFHKTAAMKAAIALDLFTEIASGNTTTADLAARTSAAERGIRILCDFLTVNNFLSKGADGYALTPSAAVFLDRRSPAYMGGVEAFMASPEMVSLGLADPIGYVRNGGSVGLGNVSPDNPVWLKFAEAMVPFVAASAAGLAAEVTSWQRPPRKVLDIAAGHGLFGIEIAKAIPGARIVAVDWQAVLELAKRNAAKAGVADRFSPLAGSAFEVDWGDDYDLILLPNFLHHFDVPTCAGLLKKVRASLAPGGRVLAIEFVPNPDRVSPPWPGVFAFVMLATTPSGDAYTADELDAMAREAGFSGIALKPLPPSPASLVEFEG